MSHPVYKEHAHIISWSWEKCRNSGFSFSINRLILTFSNKSTFSSLTFISLPVIISSSPSSIHSCLVIDISRRKGNLHHLKEKKISLPPPQNVWFLKTFFWAVKGGSCTTPHKEGLGLPKGIAIKQFPLICQVWRGALNRVIMQVTSHREETALSHSGPVKHYNCSFLTLTRSCSSFCLSRVGSSEDHALRSRRCHQPASQTITTTIYRITTFNADVRWLQPNISANSFSALQLFNLPLHAVVGSETHISLFLLLKANLALQPAIYCTHMQVRNVFHVTVILWIKRPLVSLQPTYSSCPQECFNGCARRRGGMPLITPSLTYMPCPRMQFELRGKTIRSD